MGETTNVKLDKIIEMMHILREENHQLKEKINILDSFVRRSIEDRVLNMADLVHRYKTSKSTLISNPWILPNFGISDFSIGIKRWRMATVLSWEDIAIEKRKQDWMKICQSNHKISP
ncbi:MAG: hypothetical protein ACRCVN_02115 [Spirochaetia bacterium]